MHSKKVRNITFVSLVLIIVIFAGFNLYNRPKGLESKSNEQIDNEVLVTDESVNISETTNDEIGESQSVDKELELRDKLSRFDGQDAVQINATLENPIQENEQYIVIKVQFSTHSVSLDDYDFSKIASFKSSEGIELSKEILWEKIEGEGHHYLGIYKVPKEINGKLIISKNTSTIELNISNLDDVPNRSFKWDKDVLKLIENK